MVSDQRVRMGEQGLYLLNKTQFKFIRYHFALHIIIGGWQNEAIYCKNIEIRLVMPFGSYDLSES